ASCLITSLVRLVYLRLLSHSSSSFFFFFLLIRLPPRPTLFPYTTLFRSHLRPSLHLTNELLPFFQISLKYKINPFLLHYQFSFRSEEHTSELQSRFDLVCRLLLEKKKYV